MYKSATLEALNKKRYWQLLKRLYNGTENTVKELIERRDPFIYHGTSPNNLSSIAEKGLLPGEFREFGTGTFFGSKDISELYGKLLVRLKTPSELSSKQIYPSATQAKVFDSADIKSIGPDFYRRSSYPLRNNMSKAFFDGRNKEQEFKKFKSITSRTSYLEAENDVMQRILEKVFKVRPQDENKLKFLGLLRNKRILAKYPIGSKRYEFHINTSIPKELLQEIKNG